MYGGGNTCKRYILSLIHLGSCKNKNAPLSRVVKQQGGGVGWDGVGWGGVGWGGVGWGGVGWGGVGWMNL